MGICFLYMEIGFIMFGIFFYFRFCLFFLLGIVGRDWGELFSWGRVNYKLCLGGYGWGRCLVNFVFFLGRKLGLGVGSGFRKYLVIWFRDWEWIGF